MNNKLECCIHDFLSRWPSLKNHARDLYQRTCCLLPVSNFQRCDIVTRPGYFFGFHDKCPWSMDNRELLAHSYLQQPLDFQRGGRIGIGYFSGQDFADFTQLAQSSSWNWQQGSMLQWVGQSKVVAFNDFDESGHCCRLVDLAGKGVGRLPRPVGAISPDGEKGLSYSFSRLRIGMPGYEYEGGGTSSDEVAIPGDDGLYLVETGNGASRQLFSIADIAAIAPEESFKESYHFFSHCLFSQSSQRFLFFHRWLHPSHFLFTRMISCDVDGNRLFIFPTDQIVSHVCWLDERRIVAFAKHKLAGTTYYIFEDMGEGVSVLDSYFTCDGHPQASIDGHWLVTDSYPDRFRLQELILYDLQSRQPLVMAKLQAPFPFRNQCRCDFHPRWDRLGQMISFDSAHTGVRSLCTMKVDLARYQ